MENENTIPRRNQMDKCVPAELAIFNAIQEVEKLGADTSLTDAVVKLIQAKELVSNYIDKQGNGENLK